MFRATHALVQKIKQRFLKSDTNPPYYGISPANMTAHTLSTLQRLQAAHYDAYLVGGSVRDLLLGRRPKDFDIATNATPEQVRKVFRHSRVIGRRFRLVHVYHKGEIIEVSTFRASLNDEVSDPSNNVYGTIEEDAWRRDFTVNALYYDMRSASLIDFTGGLADLSAHTIRMIGDPVQRFHEDPARLLRAIRLAAKLNFTLHDSTKKAVLELGHLLQHVSPARLSDEVIKLFFEGNAVTTFEFLEAVQYFEVLFPEAYRIIRQDKTRQSDVLIRHALQSTDTRFHEGKPLTPSYLLAVFLWPVVQYHLSLEKKHPQQRMSMLQTAIQKTLHEQSKVFLLTRRMTTMMSEMWVLQYTLEKKRFKTTIVEDLLTHRYFRAAFDLLSMRASAGEIDPALVRWWEKLQNAQPSKRRAMMRTE